MGGKGDLKTERKGPLPEGGDRMKVAKGKSVRWQRSRGSEGLHIMF